MEKKEKAPVLRFKDTNGKDYPAWEQRKLNEIASIYDGTHQTPRYTSNGIPFLSVENITTLQSSKFISEKDFLRDFPVYPKKGDVLLTRIGDVGTANVYERNQKVAFYVSLALLKLRETDPYFVNASFRSNSTRKEVWKRTLHIAFPKKINKNEIGKVNIQIPSLAEQRKIGIFFYSLDRLITLHQRKLEALKKLKRTLLQKMFPKKGHLKPELRFFGFTNDWEQRKLEDICDVRDGTHSSPKYFDNGFPLVTSKNLRDGVIDLSDVQLISKEDYLEINKRSKVDLNDILMSMIGTIGNLALIKEEPTFAIKNVALIKSTDKVKMDYLFSYLSSPSSKCDIDKSVEGGTQKFLSLTKVRGLKILLPGIEEQQKIGSFSVLLDGVITLHQRKLEIYKKLKKGLLQKMFI